MKSSKLSIIFFVNLLVLVTNSFSMEQNKPSNNENQSTIKVVDSENSKQLFIDALLTFAPNLTREQLEEMSTNYIRAQLLHFFITTNRKNRLEAISMLLALGGDPTVVLEIAIENRDIKVARLALAYKCQNKVDINSTVYGGDTLLIRAIKSQLPNNSNDEKFSPNERAYLACEMVKLLINAEVDIHKPNDEGKTPIMIANEIMGSSMYNNNMDIPDVLYKAGINPWEGKLSFF